MKSTEKVSEQKKLFLDIEKKTIALVDELTMVSWLLVLENYIESLNETYSVSVKFVSSRAMKQLNSKFLNKTTPTNVLAFPIKTDNDPFHSLGDIAICSEVVADEAKEQGKKVKDHLAHLFIHGVLHLLGYRHSSTLDSKKMELMEIKVLSELGIGNPY